MKLYLSKFILPITADPIENGALVVDKNRIRDCGPASEILAKYPKAEREDLGNTVLLPGLINAHCHLELTHASNYLYASYEDPSGEFNFIRWLIDLSKYQDALKPEDKRKALQEGLSSLRYSGTTTVGDLTTYEGAFTCYQESGLRVVTYPELLNINQKQSQDRFESALAFVDEVIATDHPKIRAGLAPYAPYTLSKNLLKIFYQHLKQLNIPVQIHTSMSFAEMEFFYDSKGDIANILFPHIGWGDHLPPPHKKTPIQYLHSIEFLQGRPALVGCVHLGPTDLALIAHSKASIVYCPNVNETLQLGRAPIRKILKEKIPVGLGSDHLGCNSSLSVWDEMRKALELSQKENEPLTAEEVLTMATWGGAYNLGKEKEIGSLDKGKLADFLVMQTPPHTTLSNVTEQVVQKTSPEGILKRVISGEEISIL
jgi:cytosine/adenosine deaminase-related metal-dependent hydrolase